VSSAILLVAIVAIWACALIPRWVRRSHDAPYELAADDEVSPGQEDDAYQAETSYHDEVTGQAEPGYEAEDFDEYPETATSQAEDDRETGAAGLVPHAHVVPGHHAGPGTLAGHLPSATAADQPTHTVHTSEQPYKGPVTGDRPSEHGRSADGPVAGPPPRQHPASPSLPPHPPAHPSRPQALPAHPQALPARPSGTDRAHALRARRRTLTMLATLFIAIFAGAVLGIVQWWLTVPPALMVGFYLLLLRAAVQADAENAARRAAAQARAAAAARSARAAAAARERTRIAAEAARQAQPTAEVIDIGDRAAQAASRDEPYDQYTDATARAIGD
jgi:hypothetical protein